MYNYFTLKQYLQSAWKSRSAVKALVGAKYDGDTEFNFGSVPTEKVQIDLDDDNTIARVRTYSGLSWSSRSGYGAPTVDTDLI